MKKNKSVTFQLADPFEANLHAAAQKEHNFSGLIKRLYAKHLEGQPQRNTVQPIRKPGGGVKLDL